MKKHEIKYIEIDKLKLNERNPRINDGAVDTVAKSIEKYGFKNPLIVDTSYTVYCGNTRLKAALKLGLKEAPCIVADDLTKEEIREYAIIDNKSNEIAEWDLNLLEEELNELDLSDFDLDWGLPEIDDTDEVVEDEFDADEALEQIEKPKSKLGDIYRLGEHYLMCGDSTNEEQVNKLCKNEIDLVVTDPPYNINYGEIEKDRKIAKGSKASADRSIKNDNMDSESFYQFLLAFYKTTYSIIKGGGAIYVFHSTKESTNFENAMKDAGFKLSQTLIWGKDHFTLGRSDYQWKHEPIFYGWKVAEGKPHYFIEDRTQSTIFESDGYEFDKMKKEELVKLLEKIFELNNTILYDKKPLLNEEHPTMKPITLCARLIRNSSKVGESVYDGFGGSGATLMACEQLKRKCYIMEIDPRYVDVIIQRWETFTGKKAEKIVNGGDVIE